VKQFIFILVFVALPTLAEARVFPQGVYCLGNVENNVNCTASPPLSNAYVDGVTLRYRWANFEPADGTYSWTEIDSDLATIQTAGKHASIMLQSGPQAPCWLINEGSLVYATYPTLVTNCAAVPSQTITVADTNNAGAIVAPWDANYLAKFNAFITALSTHLMAQNEMGIVTGVTITGVNKAGAETNLPNPTDTPGWTAVGYSASRMESAFNQILVWWGQAFTDQALIVRYTFASWPTGFSPPTCASGSSSLVRDLSDIAQSAYPLRYMFAYNGLDATTYGNMLPQMCPIGGNSIGAGTWADCNNTALSCISNIDLNTFLGGISYYGWEGLQDLSASEGDGNAATVLTNIKSLTTHNLYWEVYPVYFTAANLTAFNNAKTYLDGQSTWQNCAPYTLNNASGTWR